MHKHHHCCHHKNLKYCAICNAAYCTDCGKEWYARSYYYWGQYPHWTTTSISDTCTFTTQLPNDLDLVTPKSHGCSCHSHGG